jgi:ketosteroid isomerase-like protein
MFLTAAAPAVLTQETKPLSQKEAKITAEIISKETQKWDAIRAGNWSGIEGLYADDYVSVGYAPDLTVSRRTKQEMFGRAKLGRADFQLSDIKVITSNGDTAVISFIATGSGTGPLGSSFAIFASSVWVKRKGEWKTIFYQASLKK